MSTQRQTAKRPGRENYSVHTRTRLLELMDVEEWEQLRRGEIDAADLRKKYLDETDSQSNLSGWFE